MRSNLDAHELRSALSGPAQVDSTATGGASEAPLVLVVDDERDALSVIGLALADGGYRVKTALNGAEAITMALAVRPDVVVTDLLMPLIDGIGLAKALRRNPATAAVKIVLCSGVCEENVRPLFSGYDAFLPKPFNLEDLYAALASVLRVRAA